MEIDLSWFREQILGRDLDDAEQEAIRRWFDVRTFACGESVIAQGTPGNTLFILRSGAADVMLDAHGTRQRIVTAREGALLGELTFLTGEPASANVVARETCIVYTISRTAFSEMMREQQGLVFLLFAHMLEHTAKVIRHMNEEHIGMMQYIMGRRV